MFNRGGEVRKELRHHSNIEVGVTATFEDHNRGTWTVRGEVADEFDDEPLNIGSTANLHDLVTLGDLRRTHVEDAKAVAANRISQKRVRVSHHPQLIIHPSTQVLPVELGKAADEPRIEMQFGLIKE